MQKAKKIHSRNLIFDNIGKLLKIPKLLSGFNQIQQNLKSLQVSKFWDYVDSCFQENIYISPQLNTIKSILHIIWVKLKFNQN